MNDVQPTSPAPNRSAAGAPGPDIGKRRCLARHASLAVLTAVLVACGGQAAHEAASAPPGPADRDAAEAVQSAPPVPAADSADLAARHDMSPAPVAQMRRAQGEAGILAQYSGIVAAPKPDRENYAHVEPGGIRVARDTPVSTFSIDVDTGAYSNLRRILHEGRLPPEDAVRVEEMINYFRYGYASATFDDAPFGVQTELAPTPWNPDTLLLQIGVQSAPVSNAERKPANLVFLLDVSGSMESPDKLPLLKDAFRTLTASLDERDRVAIVVYAGASGVALEPTAGTNHAAIADALDALRAGGSTNGASGIRLAYDVARSAFIEGGINRVLLATDGDFNVGTTSFEALLDMAERERQSGIALTTLGFGRGNYNDRLMEQLADAGNGNHAYIDTAREARKVLGEQLGATLQTVASDVKIQVEFNPAQVAEYRLIGYENRALAQADFNNDKVDAGEIGAGHSVTAIYEVTPVGSPAVRVDELRYGAAPGGREARSGELAFVRLRYKAPAGGASELLEFPVRADAQRTPRATSDDFRFAAAVAAFGQQLRGGRFLGDYALDETAALAGSALGDDRHGYRREFVSLVNAAIDLSGQAPVQVSAAD